LFQASGRRVVIYHDRCAFVNRTTAAAAVICWTDAAAAAAWSGHLARDARASARARQPARRAVVDMHERHTHTRATRQQI